jgi:hypothetical protein
LEFDMSKVSVYIGCPEEGYFVDLDLSDEEESGVRKLIAASEVAMPNERMGPWVKIPTAEEAATL